jgi:glucose-6-phosphate 1-dehydrogenase
MRRDAVEASWSWITLILDGWKEEKLSRLPDYPAGTWGPAEADCFIQADGRAWRTM